jgi:hypothetical protein
MKYKIYKYVGETLVPISIKVQGKTRVTELTNVWLDDESYHHIKVNIRVLRNIGAEYMGQAVHGTTGKKFSMFKVDLKVREKVYRNVEVEGVQGLSSNEIIFNYEFSSYFIEDHFLAMHHIWLIGA